MRNPNSPPPPQGAPAVIRRRLLRGLREMRVGAPPRRDSAFNAVRRLLAASMAADQLCASTGGCPDPGRANRFHAALSASVTILEGVHRDSLDFVIEAGLLEEMLADPTGFHAGADRGCAAVDPEAWGDVVGGAVQRVARELPAEERLTFAQLRQVAEACVRALMGRRGHG